MKQQIIVNTNISSERYSVKTLRVFQEIQSACVDGKAHHVDYGAIARKLSTSWNSVKYSVKILKRDGVIDVVDSKIKILKRLVL